MFFTIGEYNLLSLEEITDVVATLATSIVFYMASTAFGAFSSIGVGSCLGASLDALASP